MKINREQLQNAFSSIGFLPISTKISNNREGEAQITANFDFIQENPFSINSSLEFLRLFTKLRLGDFSRGLLDLFASSRPEWRESFEFISETIFEQGGDMLLEINQKQIIEGKKIVWPDESWSSMSLTLNSTPLAASEGELINRDLSDEVSRWMQLTLALVVSLIEETDFSPSSLKDLIQPEEMSQIPEGKKVKMEVNRYERSKKNRLQCISIHGAICQVCDLDFKKRYGEIGKGFIHVHHVTPLHKLGENYFLNIKKDLVPVCPNCHSMIHKRNPPYEVDELREIFKQQTNQ